MSNQQNPGSQEDQSRLELGSLQSDSNSLIEVPMTPQKKETKLEYPFTKSIEGKMELNEISSSHIDITPRNDCDWLKISEIEVLGHGRLKFQQQPTHRAQLSMPAEANLANFNQNERIVSMTGIDELLENQAVIPQQPQLQSANLNDQFGFIPNEQAAQNSRNLRNSRNQNTTEALDRGTGLQIVYNIMNVNYVSNQNAADYNINGEIRNQHGALESEGNIQGPREDLPSIGAESEQIQIQKSTLLNTNTNTEANQAPNQEDIEQQLNPEQDEETNEFLKAMGEDGLGQFMKFWIQRPLNQREIMLALDEMNDIHPLKTVPIEEIFKSLRCVAPCLKKWRSSFQEKEEELTYDELIMRTHGHSHGNSEDNKGEGGHGHGHGHGQSEDKKKEGGHGHGHGHAKPEVKKEEGGHGHGHGHAKPEVKKEEAVHGHGKSEEKKPAHGHGHSQPKEEKKHGHEDPEPVKKESHGHGNGSPEPVQKESHGHSGPELEKKESHGHGGPESEKKKASHGHGHGHGGQEPENKEAGHGHGHGGPKPEKKEAGHGHGHGHGGPELEKKEAGQGHGHGHGSGKDPLEELAKDPKFKKIPPVILEQILREHYNLQCMLDLEQFYGSEQVIQTVVEYIWQEYDTDKSGALDFEETKRFMQDGLLSLGMPNDYKLDGEFFMNVFTRYDEDKSGTIDKDEMIILIKSMLGGTTDKHKIYTKPKLRKIKQFEGTEPIQDGINIYLEKLSQREASVSNRQNQKDRKNDENQEDCQIETDLIDDFGVGVASYFTLIKILISVFFILTLLFMPVFYHYYQGGAFNHNETLSTKEKIFLETSMGNLGHSVASCLHQYIAVDEPFHIKCYKGKLSSIWQFGLMPSQSERDFKLDFCGSSQAPDTPHREIETCTKNFLDKDKLFEKYDRDCTGKQKCDFNLRDFVKHDIDGVLGLTREQAEECVNQYASVYLQYACDFEELEFDHQKIGLYVTVTGILGIFVFRFALHWMRVTSDLDLIMYDINTTSLVDFSVQVELPQKVWDSWKWYKESNPGTKTTFKDFFKQEFEKQVQALPQVLPLKKDEPLSIKIARVQFAYDNQLIWEDLSKRAQFLKNGNGEKVIEFEKSILEKCQENIDDFQRPVHAFVVFESQECQERVFEYISTSQSLRGKVTWHESGKALKIFGHKLEVYESPEPTDVIWENLHLDQWQIFKNWLAAYAKVLTVQMFNLIAFITIQGLLSGVNARYPPTLRCYAVTQIFGNSEEEVFEPLKEYAKYDKEDTLKQEGRGYYQCFCQDYNNNFADINDSEALCQRYQQDMLFKLIGENVISFATVILNLVLKTVIQSVVHKIGLKTISETNDQLCQFLFISQFINTGIIGLLSNADLEYSPLGFIPLKRRHADFTDKWYMEFGVQITFTMIIQAFMPYSTVVAAIVSTKLKQIKDAGTTNTKKVTKTKAKTIPQFIDSHAGPHTEFHTRYAFIFNSIFVCFTYGLALPLLFPITLLSMINMYISERYLFAYYYRKPPLYGPAMHNGALKILYYAPYFMIFFGYWQLGNRQIFFNEAQPLVYAKQSYDPQHKAFDYSGGVSHTLILLLMVPICYFFRQYLKVIRRAGISLKFFKQPAHIDMEWRIGDLDVDENLGNYWNCIPGQMQFRHYVQETHFQNSLGIKTVDDQTLENLRVSKRGKKVFVDLANFDPLENPVYINKFLYQPMDRRFDSKASDFVAKTLYQGEMIENQQQNS